MPGFEVACIERGLRGRAQDDCAAIVARKFVKRLCAGREQGTRQGLRLIEDDDAVGDVVQLAAARGAGGEQAFEQLHVGGDDDGRGPILHCKFELVSVGFGAVCNTRIDRTMLVLDRRLMLEHKIVAKHAAEDRGRLVDYSGKWDGVDNPFVPMHLRVVESEAERGQRLTAASRYGQREESGRIPGARSDGVQNLRPQAVDGCLQVSLFAYVLLKRIDKAR